MNADEICELLLRLPPGGALILPAEVGRQTVEIAIRKAAGKDSTLVLTIGEQLSPVTSEGPPRRYPRIERAMTPSAN